MGSKKPNEFSAEIYQTSVLSDVGKHDSFLGFIMTPYGILSRLSPSEQVVFLRLWLRAENGEGKGRYIDIAREANVSLATMKRVMRTLKEKGLV
jgi:hypothetical protein